jgi:hypothetical protein
LVYDTCSFVPSSSHFLLLLRSWTPRTHSLENNIIGDAGACVIAEALKSGATLIDLRCVSHTRTHPLCPAHAHVFLYFPTSRNLADLTYTVLKATISVTRVRTPWPRHSGATRRWRHYCVFPSISTCCTRDCSPAPCFLHLFPHKRAYSLGRNTIGDEGAYAMAEALNTNATLEDLKCAS